MQPYRDIDNDSGVLEYESGEDYIQVRFKSGSNRLYIYTYGSAGAQHVEEMKRLAAQGDGLNSYIQRNKPGYESKS